jgi:hypothetical protein
MNKYKILVISLIITLFWGGCYSTGLKVFDKNDIFEKGFQYTQKADLIQNHHVKLMMIATYLNPIDKKYQDDNENLIVGIYFDDDLGVDYITRGYDFNITNAQNISINKLPKDDILLENLPLKNSWATYYKLSYRYDDTNETKANRDKVIIKLENTKESKSVKISFEKLL